MDVDPPAEEEEPMEVDPPLTGKAWSYPGMSLLSTMRAQQARRRSVQPALYVQCSLRIHHLLGQNHRSGCLVGLPERHCRNK